MGPLLDVGASPLYSGLGGRGGVVGLLLDVGASPLYSGLGDRGGVVGPLLDVGLVHYTVVWVIGEVLWGRC